MENEIFSKPGVDFRKITEDMANLYEKKNSDYGNSFSESFDEFGPIAGVVRISDKFNRLKNLIKHDVAQKILDESLGDTLIDMANYCIMLKMELDKIKDKEASRIV